MLTNFERSSAMQDALEGIIHLCSTKPSPLPSAPELTNLVGKIYNVCSLTLRTLERSQEASMTAQRFHANLKEVLQDKKEVLVEKTRGEHLIEALNQCTKGIL